MDLSAQRQDFNEKSIVSDNFKVLEAHLRVICTSATDHDKFDYFNESGIIVARLELLRSRISHSWFVGSKFGYGPSTPKRESSGATYT